MLGSLLIEIGIDEQLAEDAAILLIVGGLLMLGIVVVLVLLRALFPVSRAVAGDRFRGTERTLVPTPALAAGPAAAAPARAIVMREHARDEGRRAGRRIKAKEIDDVLDTIVRNGWGQPRILRIVADRALIRYYECSECGLEAAKRPAGGHGCGFQAGYLEGAFGSFLDQPVQVREVHCRRHGDMGCEFEVRT